MIEDKWQSTVMSGKSSRKIQKEQHFSLVIAERKGSCASCVKYQIPGLSYIIEQRLVDCDENRSTTRQSRRLARTVINTQIHLARPHRLPRAYWGMVTQKKGVHAPLESS